MRFTIVVVCLNAGDKLLRTVESIMGQTCGDYEILIKDGMSSDGSLSGLPADERIKICRRRDKGIYDAMNQAVEKAVGEYIYFLNSGDLFYDETVLRKVDDAIKKLEKRSSVPDNGEAAASFILYGDIFERVTKARVSSNPHMDAFGCYRNVPCHQACFYGAQLMRGKRFDTRYLVRADYEHFLWCFFRGGATVFYLPLPVADYEGGGFSETEKNRRRSAKEHGEIVRKYMSAGQIFGFRLLLLLTLAPLRTWLAENKTTALTYNKIKKLVYRNK